jgi:hypothetical protein
MKLAAVTTAGMVPGAECGRLGYTKWVEYRHTLNNTPSVDQLARWLLGLVRKYFCAEKCDRKECFLLTLPLVEFATIVKIIGITPDAR